MMHLQDLKPILKNKENINAEYIMRFSRMAERFGYDKPNTDIIQFCSLIVDDPPRFKNTELITSKWKAPKTLSEMFRAVKIVCGSNTIRPKLGDKYNDIIKQLDLYKKDVLQSVQTGQSENLVQTNKEKDESLTAADIEHINNAKPPPPIQKNKQKNVLSKLYKAIESDRESNITSSSHKSTNTLKTLNNIGSLCHLDTQSSIKIIKDKGKNKNIIKNKNLRNRKEDDHDYDFDTESISSAESVNKIDKKEKDIKKEREKGRKENVDRVKMSKKQYKRIMRRLLDIQESTNEIMLLLQKQF